MAALTASTDAMRVLSVETLRRDLERLEGQIVRGGEADLAIAIAEKARSELERRWVQCVPQTKRDRGSAESAAKSGYAEIDRAMLSTKLFVIMKKDRGHSACNCGD